MKKEPYFKMEMNIFSDMNVMKMLSKLDAASSIGVYVMLLTHLRKEEGYEASCSADCIEAFAYIHRFELDLVRRVLTEFDLFVIDEEQQTFRSPYIDRVMADYEALVKRGAEMGKKNRKKTKKQQKPANTEVELDNQQKKREEKNREYSSNTTTAKKSSSSSSNIFFGDNNWETLIDEMGESTSYMELAKEKSKLGKLFDDHREYIFDVFKAHVELFGTEEQIVTLSDAKRYFSSFIAHGSRTAADLRSKLQVEVNRKEENNPYRFEYKLDGKRMFLGIPIPDDAPPRPTAGSFWNVHSHKWIG